MTDNEALLDVILNEIRDLKESVVDLDHAIRGNGNIGLKQRVSELEGAMQRQHQTIARVRNFVGASLLAGLPMLWDWAKHKWGW